MTHQEEQAIRARCATLKLDPSRVVFSVQLGFIVATVALYGEEGNWPASHVAAARDIYKETPA